MRLAAVGRAQSCPDIMTGEKPDGMLPEKLLKSQFGIRSLGLQPWAPAAYVTSEEIVDNKTATSNVIPPANNRNTRMAGSIADARK